MTLRHRSRWNSRTSRLSDDWTLQSGNHIERHKIQMRIYNGTEIRSLLRLAGFSSSSSSTIRHWGV